MLILPVASKAISNCKHSLVSFVSALFCKHQGYNLHFLCPYFIWSWFWLRTFFKCHYVFVPCLVVLNTLLSLVSYVHILLFLFLCIQPQEGHLICKTCSPIIARSFLFWSSPPRWPNKPGKNVCPSVRTYVRTFVRPQSNTMQPQTK